jgi:serine/threonine protein kinase/tetratricopeptide (TPR) repeat protein
MERPDQIESILADALELASEAERREFVERECGDDVELRRRVEELIENHFRAGSFLEGPAVSREVAAAAPRAGPGTVIGPYKLVEQIGEGGFGAVFMAEQQQPIRRKVALKILKPGMDTAQVVARFEAERQALALMDHPNIAHVFDGGETGTGRPYFVMELVKGVPITKYCDEHQLTPRERLALFVTVCEAVQHAHQKGIIHRDIKPSNVLVAAYDGRPVPKVIDFGVAKALGESLTERTLITSFGGIIGTLEYMSPEQAEFNAVDVDTRADIYSLGVLLYELLTGTTPLTKKRLKEAAITEVLRLIREEEPPTPSTRLSGSKDSLASISAQRKLEPVRLTKEVRGELDWIVMKCLEKERTRRYETANGLARDIQRYLNDEPVEAGPPSATYKLRKFARKHRRLLAGAGAFALLLIVATGVSIGLAVWALRAEKTAKDERDNARVEKERADEEAEISEAVNTFLNKDLLFQAAPESSPDRELKLRTVLDRAAEKIEGRFPDKPLVEARVRWTLSKTYNGLGEIPAARRHAERALELYTAHLGPEHHDTMALANELIGLLRYQGKYEEARQKCEELLETRRRVLGPDHRDTLMSIGNLAIFSFDLSRVDEAKALFEKALEGQRRTLGADHVDTLQTMNALAVIHLTQGRLSEARTVHEDVLAIQSRRLGPEHPQTLASLHNLATVLYQQGEHSKALALREQALEIDRRVFGPEHPTTLLTMNNLGTSLEVVGRVGEAIKLLEETLAIRRRVSGSAHRETRNVAYNLAWLWVTAADAELRNPGRAVELAKELVQLQPENASYLSVLGIASYRVSDWQGAITALEKSQAIEPVQNIAKNGFFLAMAHFQQGDKQKARDWYDRAVKSMDENRSKDKDLRRFRAEASGLLASEPEA